MQIKMPRSKSNSSDADFGGPEHLRIKSEEDFEAKILEALQRPGHEMTDARWEEMIRRFRERYAKSHHQ